MQWQQEMYNFINGKKNRMAFVGNSVLFPAVKEFWTPVKNWQSDRHEFGVLRFWDIVY